MVIGGWVRVVLMFRRFVHVVLPGMGRTSLDAVRCDVCVHFVRRSLPVLVRSSAGGSCFAMFLQHHFLHVFVVLAEKFFR